MVGVPNLEVRAKRAAYMRQWRMANYEKARLIEQRAKAKRRPKKLEEDRRYAAAHREEFRQKAREWSRNNKARKKETNRKWYEANKAHVKELANNWRKNNRERYLELWRRYSIERQSRLRNNAPSERVDLTAVKLRCGWICGICGENITGKFHYDHIVPVSRGGGHTTDNLQMAHPSCNRRKNNKLNFTLRR